MNVLIIGYGSIGKRHCTVLNSFEFINKVYVVTNQNNVKIQNSFSKLEDINDITYFDYFVIANETGKHFKTLKYIVKHVNKKFILVEKPLFEEEYYLNIRENKIFVGYDMRYNPVIDYIRNYYIKEKILFVNIHAGHYLPNWRPTQDYTKSYSARFDEGGVLRDLSHELDYIVHLFGKISKIEFLSKKVSSLNINSDDLFMAIGTTNKNIVFNLTLDYISKIPYRKLIIHTESSSMDCNLNTGEINSSLDLKFPEYLNKCLDHNHTYRELHSSILTNNYKNTSTYDEGLATVKLIDKILKKDNH